MPPAAPPAAPAAQDAPAPSRRAAAIKPFHVMEVIRAAADQQARTGEKVLHLGVGQPSAAPPAAVTAAAAAALRLPPAAQGYTPTAGIPALRAGLSALYASRYDAHVPPEALLVTTGSSGAFAALFAAAFDARDRVALPVPGYPCYRNVLAAMSVDVAPLPVGPATNYQPTVAQLRAAHAAAPLRGLVLASPANPTGAVLAPPELAAIAAFCAQEGVLLVADEIYHGLTRRPAPTAAHFPLAVVVGSFSKLWCMPGLRVGWVVVRGAALRAAVERALQNMAISAPAVAQHAAVAALDPCCMPELEAHARRYLEDADRLVGVLRDAGFEDVRPPDGAFYVWARCEKVCRLLGVAGSKDLCRLLLEKLSVALTPGIDFDPERGEKFVRFSCAGSSEDIAEGAQRILKLIQETAAKKHVDIT